MKPLRLGIGKISLEDIGDVAFKKRRVELSPAAEKRIAASRNYLLAQVESGKTLYGVNTGFGLLSNVKVAPEQVEELQYNLLRSHAVGMGAYLADHFVRAMLLLRASTLAIGNSGVSVELVRHILAVLNKGICPLIPEQGSVGASGDLAPLAHLALVLIGEGRARLNGREMSGAKALQTVGLKPIRLGAKEGLALINGTQFMTALGSLALLDAEHLSDLADLAGAMTTEALRGTSAAFDPAIHEARPHPGQILVAKRMRTFLVRKGKSQIAKSHENCSRVQDPYSLRCIPQVHGASRDMLAYVRTVIEREINSVTDNPLVFPEVNKILSGGNFHGQYVSMALDALAIAVAELASISEQRIEKLINPAISDLPAFLTKNGGLNSGFMIVQVAAASIVSENKTLCHPACVDTIPTSADKEDHVSMGAWAACKALRVLSNSRKVMAMELMCAAQGIDMLRPLHSSRHIEAVHALIRKKVRRLDQDRFMHDDMRVIEGMIEKKIFEKIAKG